MTSIMTDVQTGASPGFDDVQNIIDALKGRKGQAIALKTPTTQVTQFTVDDNGVKASYDLGVHAPTRVLVDGYDLKAGMVMMWAGLTTGIPACWLLCNGTLGTADLRDKFIVGAGTTYNWGSVGGAISTTLAHTHDLSNHTHTMANHVHAGAAHTHSHAHTGDAHTHSHSHTGAVHQHVHSHTGPSHNHTVSVSADGAGNTNVNLAFGGPDTTANKAHSHSASTALDGTGATSTDATAPAFSTFTGADASGASAANTGTDASAASSANTGTPSPNTSDAPSTNTSSGASATAIATLPPYYGLFYIQRAA